MGIVNSTQVRLLLPVLRKADKAQNDVKDSGSGAESVFASETYKVDAGTTVTTIVMASSDSRLPNLSLEDVLEISGVESNAKVLLNIDDGVALPDSMGHKTVGSAVDVTANEQQIQAAVDIIESSDAVVVEVETTDNTQIVKVRAVDIEAIYTKAGTAAGSSGAGTAVLSNFLLLKNGWAYTDLESSPLELHVTPSEQTLSNGWVMWRSAENGTHEIQDAITGAWNRLVGQVVDTSAKTAADLAGVFMSDYIEEQLLSTITARTTLQLSAEGVFTNTRKTLTTSSNALPDISYVMYTVKSSGGRSAGFSGTSGSDGHSSATVGSVEKLSEVAGDMFGAFRMLDDGVTLEMQFADGTIERRLFLKTSQGSLSIDGQNYSRYGDVSSDFLENLMSLLVGSGDRDLRGKWLKSIAEAMQRSAKAAVPSHKAEDTSSKGGPPE